MHRPMYLPITAAEFLHSPSPSGRRSLNTLLAADIHALMDFASQGIEKLGVVTYETL